MILTKTVMGIELEDARRLTCVLLAYTTGKITAVQAAAFIGITTELLDLTVEAMATEAQVQAQKGAVA